MQAMSYRHVSAAAANLSAVRTCKIPHFYVAAIILAESLPWMSVAEIHLQSYFFTSPRRTKNTSVVYLSITPPSADRYTRPTELHRSR